MRVAQTAERTHPVEANPLRTVELNVRDTTIRTGDVLRLQAVGKGSDGREVANAPMVWSYTYAPDDSLVPAGHPGGAENPVSVGTVPTHHSSTIQWSTT